MVVVLDGKRLKATLVEMAAARGAAMGVPALGMSVREPAEKLGQFAGPFGPKKEMPMVGHQAIAEHAHRLPLDRFE